MRRKRISDRDRVAKEVGTYLFTILVHSSIFKEAVLFFCFLFFNTPGFDKPAECQCLRPRGVCTINFTFFFPFFFSENTKKISNPQRPIKRLLTWLHWVQKDWLLSIAVEHKVKKRATIPMMVPLFECNLPREAMGVCMSVVRVDHTYF